MEPSHVATSLASMSVSEKFLEMEPDHVAPMTAKFREGDWSSSEDEKNPADECQPRSNDRKKARKKTHERARKQRRKAERAAKQGPRTAQTADWVEDARQQAQDDEIDLNPNEYVRVAYRILPGVTTPGILGLITPLITTQRGPVNPKQLENSIKHAVTHGVKNERAIIEQADKDYKDDLAKYATKHAPRAKLPATIATSELATFRRAWPIGTTIDDSWCFEVTCNNQGSITINFQSTPFMATDGSLEEAVFTLLALPTKHGPNFHVTLPMMRKALFDVNHGSTEHLTPSAGKRYKYASVTHHKMKNPIELARWLQVFAAKLTEKQKQVALEHAQDTWNCGKIPLVDEIPALPQSEGNNPLMHRMIFGMLAISQLPLNLPSPDEEAPREVSNVMLKEYMLQHKLCKR